MKAAPRFLALAGLLYMLCPCAWATPVTTLCGTSLCFEINESQAAVSLFGAPTVVGDALRFLPPAFRVESANGAGPVTDLPTLTVLSVYSTLGQAITGITVTQAGDYDISQSGSVSLGTLLSAGSLSLGFTTIRAPTEERRLRAALQTFSLKFPAASRNKIHV